VHDLQPLYAQYRCSLWFVAADFCIHRFRLWLIQYYNLIILNKTIAYSKTIDGIIKPSGERSIKLVVEKLFKYALKLFLKLYKLDNYLTMKKSENLTCLTRIKC